MCVLSVTGRTNGTAKLESSAHELEAQAYIECHIRVVSMHVKAKVLALTVPDDKAVVTVPTAASIWPQQLAKWLQSLLDLVNERLKTNVIDDYSIIVHAVRAFSRESARIKIEYLLHKQVAKRITKQLERKYLPSQVFSQ
jgi:hypothetical protein